MDRHAKNKKVLRYQRKIKAVKIENILSQSYLYKNSRNIKCKIM